MGHLPTLAPSGALLQPKWSPGYVPLKHSYHTHLSPVQPPPSLNHRKKNVVVLRNSVFSIQQGKSHPQSDTWDPTSPSTASISTFATSSPRQHPSRSLWEAKTLHAGHSWAAHVFGMNQVWMTYCCVCVFIYAYEYIYICTYVCTHLILHLLHMRGRIEKTEKYSFGEGLEKHLS